MIPAGREVSGSVHEGTETLIFELCEYRHYRFDDVSAQDSSATIAP
jgi:hypothetical protein